MSEPEPLQQVDRTCVFYRGQKVVYFSGCDYFRMSSHPRVVAALHGAVTQYGVNVAASRLTTGNHVVYQELEAELCRYFGVPAATLTSTGYTANVVAAQALAGQFSHALLDDGAHPSLADAARFLECPVLRFAHGDAADLGRRLKGCGAVAVPLVLTDGMVSHDGSVAPLAGYLEVLPAKGSLLVDDAHGAGVVGRTGRGSLEQAGVARRRIIQTVTLSKAFGGYGGAVLGPAALRRQIFKRSHVFVGSTPPPLPLARAALEGLRLLCEDPTLRERLVANRDYVKRTLRDAGFPAGDTPGPIVGWVPTSARKAAALKAALLDAGIYPPFLKYPGRPASGFFRFVLSSEHRRAELDRLLAVLRAQM